MSPILRSLLTNTLCLLINGAGFAGELRQQLFVAKSYSGSRDRQYQVFVPSSCTGSGRVLPVMNRSCYSAAIAVRNDFTSSATTSSWKRSASLRSRIHQSISSISCSSAAEGRPTSGFASTSQRSA
jgi:hypothetical protein